MGKRLDAFIAEPWENLCEGSVETIPDRILCRYNEANGLEKAILGDVLKLYGEARCSRLIDPDALKSEIRSWAGARPDRRTIDLVLDAIDHTPSYGELCPITGDTSDGYHTFNELYHHRAILFSVICNTYPHLAWKSKQHHDPNDPMYDGMFVVGIDTPNGQATYHYDIEPYWNMFHIKELDRAPKWDGHTAAEAIERIGSLRPDACGMMNCICNIGDPVYVLYIALYSVDPADIGKWFVGDSVVECIYFGVNGFALNMGRMGAKPISEVGKTIFFDKDLAQKECDRRNKELKVDANA